MPSGRKKEFDCGHRGRGQYCHRCKQEEDAANGAQDEARPSSVREAVEIAERLFASTLDFGAAVKDGVASVAPEAGPPDKILRYLCTLSDMTEARWIGPLGTTMIKWLDSKGLSVSTESETVMNSGARRWPDGAGLSRPFKFHLKPSEATAPDRCVRIYFDFDENRGRTIIGWIGRHP